MNNSIITDENGYCWHTKLSCQNIPLGQRFVFDLTPARNHSHMHLILTGRNGCGKTTTLLRLAETLSGNLLQARRHTVFKAVDGPTAELTLKKPELFEQYLVNLRTRQAYASEEGDTDLSQKMSYRLQGIERELRKLFDGEDFCLHFSREWIRYLFKFGDRAVQIAKLPDGYANILGIWATIQSALSSLPKGFSYHPTRPFIVLIDELEAHLHLSMQERTLGFLTAFFPQVQFIIATHSPLVMSSIDGAVIYDLSTGDRRISDELRGMRYGTLMTHHFGISSDFDLRSTKDLKVLRLLSRDSDRTPEETARMEALASKLQSTSDSLALEVFRIQREALL